MRYEQWMSEVSRLLLGNYRWDSASVRPCRAWRQLYKERVSPDDAAKVINAEHKPDRVGPPAYRK